MGARLLEIFPVLRDAADAQLAILARPLPLPRGVLPLWRRGAGSSAASSRSHRSAGGCLPRAASSRISGRNHAGRPPGLLPALAVRFGENFHVVEAEADARDVSDVFAAVDLWPVLVVLHVHSVAVRVDFVLRDRPPALVARGRFR